MSLRRVLMIILICSFVCAATGSQALASSHLPSSEWALLTSSSCFENVPPKSSATVVVFWATWCRYCHQELQILQKLSSDHSQRGLRIETINVDEDKEEAKAFLAKHKIALSTSYCAHSSVLKTLSIDVLPTVYVFDSRREKLLRVSGISPQKMAAIKKQIDKVLSQKTLSYGGGA